MDFTRDTHDQDDSRHSRVELGFSGFVPELLAARRGMHRFCVPGMGPPEARTLVAERGEVDEETVRNWPSSTRTAVRAEKSGDDIDDEERFSQTEREVWREVWRDVWGKLFCHSAVFIKCLGS